jgi:hypothetical protein
MCSKAILVVEYACDEDRTHTTTEIRRIVAFLDVPSIITYGTSRAPVYPLTKALSIDNGSAIILS